MPLAFAPQKQAEAIACAFSVQAIRRPHPRKRLLLGRHSSCMLSSMIAPRSSFLRKVCAVFLLLSVSGSVAKAATEWQVIKVGRWDYLTIDNIAKFYGFAGDVTPINKTIRLDNGSNQLEVTLDSREAIVNGVRNWLCFPVIQHGDGKFLVSRIDLAKTIEPQF